MIARIFGTEIMLICPSAILVIPTLPPYTTRCLFPLVAFLQLVHLHGGKLDLWTLQTEFRLAAGTNRWLLGTTRSNRCRKIKLFETCAGGLASTKARHCGRNGACVGMLRSVELRPDVQCRTELFKTEHDGFKLT